MITVYSWNYPWAADEEWCDVMYVMVAPDTPEVNANCPDDELKCQDYIVAAWNQTFPNDQKTWDDFDFVAPPEDWVNPNK